jgi:hypothetical protein
MSTAQVIPLPRKPPHPGELLRIIRELAEAGAVSFSSHAFDDRRPERGIDMPDALKVLKRGMIKGSIVPGDGPGEWKCLVVDKAEKSSRWIGVATVVINARRILIATVEWEDK